jgi:hypothetical protein
MSMAVQDIAPTAGEQEIHVDQLQVRAWRDYISDQGQVVGTVYSGVKSVAVPIHALFLDAAVGAMPVMTDAEFLALQYREGKLLPPTAASMTSEEEEQLERRIRRHSKGLPLTDLLINARDKARGFR